MIGSRFGRYRVEQELGRGDFGVTCRAVDVEGSGRELAFKVAHAHLCQDDLFQALLERECAPLRGLRHPGIAAFQGLTAEGGQLVAARELVAGEDLRRVIARGRVPVEHVPGLLELALRALAHAHQQRVIHGDISPTNIFWCYDGSLRLTDFGLARAVHVAEATRTGAPSGHADYMAPELAEGVQSARSDLYSIGLIAYECLVGHPACEPGDAASKAAWHRNKGLPDPRVEQPDCPDWLARVLMQLAAIEPSTRPKDADAALMLLRPVRAPTVGDSNLEPSTQIGSSSSGLVPPPPPERTPPAPPTIERPVLEDTVATTAPEGFGGGGFSASAGFGTGGGFGRTVTEAPPASAPSAPLSSSPGLPSPPLATGAPVSATAAAGVAAPRVPASASARGVDRRLDPPTAQERALAAKRERIRVAVFWSVAVGVLLVSVVAFVGYRAIEARRLAAARATGPDFDPELLLGGGYDRYGEPPEVEKPGGGGRSSAGNDDDVAATDPNAKAAVQQRPAAGANDERYLLGGGAEATGEYGHLSLSSNPIGARIWVDNQELGYTPLEAHSLREGRHVVRLELEGFAWSSQAVEVRRGELVDLGNVTLEREVVAAGPVLLWSVELEGSSVFVDGTHAGRMPVVVEMTPGPHTFFVQPSQGEPIELELIAYPGTDDDPGRLQLEPR